MEFHRKWFKSHVDGDIPWLLLKEIMCLRGVEVQMDSSALESQLTGKNVIF